MPQLKHHRTRIYGFQHCPHKRKHLRVPLGARHAIEFRPHAHRCTGREQPLGARTEHRACVAEPHRAWLLEAPSIDARRLGRDIGAQAHHAARVLIHHLKGLQIELGATGHGKGIHKLEKGRIHELKARQMEEIEKRAAQTLQRPRSRRQDFVDALWQ